jgi:hypothetical protein
MSIHFKAYILLLYESWIDSESRKIGVKVTPGVKIKE